MVFCEKIHKTLFLASQDAQEVMWVSQSALADFTDDHGDYNDHDDHDDHDDDDDADYDEKWKSTTACCEIQPDIETCDGDDDDDDDI